MLAEVRDGDVEGALSRLKKGLLKVGFFRELKRREAYAKPSVRKRRKQVAARKRLRKSIRQRAEYDRRHAED